MSNIIQKADGFLQIVKIVFPKKIHKLLEFGFKAVSLQRIVSLNCNARSSVANRHTAESKIYRLTKNLRFVKQNTFIINAIKEFLKIIAPIKVKLVFDRGFACPSIIKYLAEIKVKFYIRIKSIKSVKNKKKKAKQFKPGKYIVSAYVLDYLSLTITPPPRNDNEPWYIISNDTESTAEEIQKIYYYRFEIEELFKDAKRVFGLEYINFKKQHNFKTALWFVILGIWLHYYLEATVEQAKTIIKKCKQSFNQSITHYWMERIKLAIQLPVLNQIFIKDG